ncbi:ammonium transporter [Rhodothermus marinus]|uniref:ammonium transporter n=1 Tax=Rhodothermus marinus TaxID=29549 RepID=UPI0012BA5218|nr:ammonium transporter [Rhodothermus marinus]BBM70861.1 ammonium transporter [Rhodothermus marinus]BBM73840.1 ammonium transporter [Rhodothermus marinus]
MRTTRRYAHGLLLTALGLLLASPVLAADPSGKATLEADPTAPANFVWVLVAAFLVFFMQPGFALLEAGLTRAKNTVNILTKNVLDFCMAALAFWAFGYALMFGGSGMAPGLEQGNPFIGYSGFFLTGEAYDVSTILYWLFQMVFAATAATIVSGAMAERTKVTAYLAYSFLVSALIYPIYGHWVWGSGWLGEMGAVDFAGSGVVHAVGGILALIGAKKLGPRIGKYDEQGRPRPIPGHNLALATLGVFILFFGWFGFNAGSTVAATELRISVIATNTALAAVAGGVAAMYLTMIRTGHVDLLATCNGILAGLVAITAPCAFVAPWAAVVIGALGGVVMLWAVHFVEHKLKIDDPVGAFAVHGAAGLFGVLAVGIFADGTYGVSGLIVGDTHQLLVQLISIVALVLWTSLTGWLLFTLLDKTMGLRVSREHELAGLDVTEHGVSAYVFENGLAEKPGKMVGA